MTLLILLAGANFEGTPVEPDADGEASLSDTTIYAAAVSDGTLYAAAVSDMEV